MTADEMMEADRVFAHALSAYLDALGAAIPATGRRAFVDKVAHNVAALCDRSERAITFAVRELAQSVIVDAETTVYCVGDAGGFSELAAREYFGHAPKLAFDKRAERVIAAVAAESSSRNHHALVPLETSRDGVSTSAIVALTEWLDGELQVCGEVELRRTFALVAAEPGPAECAEIETIIATSTSFAECRQSVEEVARGAALREVASDAQALALLDQIKAAGDGRTAALVPSAGVAGRFSVLRAAMEDIPRHYTRYAVIGRDLPSRTGNDRTLLVLAIGDTPGALHNTLKPLAERGINLLRLESRQYEGDGFTTLFYLEMSGHVTDRDITTGVEALRAMSPFVRVLGSYPSGVSQSF